MELLLAAAAILPVLIYGVFPALVRRLFEAPRRVETLTPADLGLPYRTERIGTENGKRLFAWYIPVQNADPAPAVALLHGWGGNAQYLLPFARLLHAAGFAVLLLDARNHGRSDADDFSSMVKFAEDLEHGLDWLEAQPKVDAGRIGVLGHSVGAAAALLVASRRPRVRGGEHCGVCPPGRVDAPDDGGAAHPLLAGGLVGAALHRETDQRTL